MVSHRASPGPQRPCEASTSQGTRTDPATIPRLLSILSGMGVEVRVRNGTVEPHFMDPWRVFDRDPMTDERRIAATRRSPIFQEMLDREDEVIAHWRGSPGNSILNYPDEQRFLTHAFQESLIGDYRKRGLVRKLEPHSAGERWVGGRYR